MPAASITDGLEVLVQLVMAAMTTEPWRTLGSAGAVAGAAAPGGVVGFLGLISEGRAVSNDFRAPDSGTRSCGRLGPATLGSTWARSSSITSEYCASGTSGPANRPCSRQ